MGRVPDLSAEARIAKPYLVRAANLNPVEPFGRSTFLRNEFRAPAVSVRTKPSGWIARQRHGVLRLDGALDAVDRNCVFRTSALRVHDRDILQQPRRRGLPAEREGFSRRAEVMELGGC